jgi:hypothetical protein
LLAAAARDGMIAAIDAITTLRRVSPSWRRVFPSKDDDEHEKVPPSAGELQEVVEFCSELKRLTDAAPDSCGATFVLASTES